jgi:hypothetical protein
MKSNFQISITAFFVVLLFQCASTINKLQQSATVSTDTTTCKIDTQFPVWFLNPPLSSITGFYHDTVTSITDAKIRYAGYRSMYVYGKCRYFDNVTSTDFQDSISFYFDEADTSEACSLSIADSFFICCKGYLYLFVEKKSTFDTTRVSICNAEYRDIKKPGKITATGEYQYEYYNQSLCWMHAEESAIKELCERSAFRFASLRKSSGSDFSTTIRKQFDLKIKNISIDNRFYDEKDNICRVTVSCDTADIIPALFEKGNK